MPIDLLIVAAVFAVVAFVCLFWMLANLLKVVRNEGLSGDFNIRMAQTKEILLKPALLFFVVGGLSTLYFIVRNGGGGT